MRTRNSILLSAAGALLAATLYAQAPAEPNYPNGTTPPGDTTSGMTMNGTATLPSGNPGYNSTTTGVTHATRARVTHHRKHKVTHRRHHRHLRKHHRATSRS